jgi:hypothetical protein
VLVVGHKRCEDRESTWEEYENISRGFVDMDLKECPKSRVDVVCLAHSRMERLHRVLTALDVEYSRTERLSAGLGSSKFQD